MSSPVDNSQNHINEDDILEFETPSSKKLLNTAPTPEPDSVSDDISGDKIPLEAEAKRGDDDSTSHETPSTAQDIQDNINDTISSENIIENDNDKSDQNDIDNSHDNNTTIDETDSYYNTNNTNNYDLDDEEFEPDLDRAIDAKSRGNKLFGKAQYYEALECYAEALLFVPEDAIKERIDFHNNKCAAHIMLKEWDDAIYEADCVLSLDNKNIKALIRRAKGNSELEKYQEASDDYAKLSELEPSNKQHKMKEVEYKKKAEEKFEKQKDEMIGKLKGWGNTVLGYFGMSTDNFQMQQDPNTGSYSVNFVQNPTQQQPPQGQ